MVIDFHTHAYPDRIAEHAMTSLVSRTACACERDGTLDSLCEQSREDGVKSVLLAIATNPRQMHSVNDWAAQAAGREEIIAAFGSVHPDAPDVMEELDRIAALGMKGVKFHPEYQAFDPCDARMKPIYKKVAALGLITVFHAGNDPAFMPPCRVSARALETVLPWFDGAPVVAAHFGGYMTWSDVLNMRLPENLYLDTSACYNRILLPLARALAEKAGAERLLFGSDSPWTRASNSMKLVEALGLSETEKNKVYYENAAVLLGLEPHA